MKTSLRKKSIIFFLTSVAAAVVVFGFLLINGLFSRINRVSTAGRIPASEETFEGSAEGPDTVGADEVIFNMDGIGMMADNDIKNILLIGQDRREGEERQRSDSIIICSINTKEEKIKLVSLMRDLYVPIPGYSANRINAAYVFGGMELLNETIEQDFGIPIDGNVEVDFEGFIGALGVVGDLDIELTAAEAEYLNNTRWDDAGEMATNDGSWALTEGMNSLTPAQALAYARIRKIGNSDWERTERQRRVIITAFRKIGSSNAAKMLSVANSVFPFITTDLTNSELLSYAKTLAVHKITDIESYRLPVDGHYSSETINGMAVLVPDLVMNSQYLQQYLYGASIDESKVTSGYVPYVSRPTETPEPVEYTYQHTQPVFYDPEPVEPYYEQPTYDEPVQSDPVYYEDPQPDDQGGQTYEEPPLEEPVYEDPVEEPVYDEPTYEDPVYEEPTYEEPVSDGGGDEYAEAG